MEKDNSVLVADLITYDESLTDAFMETQNALHERLKNGERFDVCDVLQFPELFALRIKSNRKAIDLLGISPTTSEMDDALEMSAEVMLENIEAYEDITNPDFSD